MFGSIEKMNKTEKEKPLQVHNYLESYSPEQLALNVFNFLKKESHPPYYEKYLSYLNLQTTASDQEIKNALSERIENYKVRVMELEEKIPQYIERLKSWITTNNYVVKQNPEDVNLYFYDEILVKGTSGFLNELEKAKFYLEFNIISVDENCSENIILHEYIHSMSFDRVGKNYGFRKLITDKTLEGNSWLDEGVAVLGETETCSPELISQCFVERDDYESYLWLTKLYMKELKISQEQIFRAYFGEKNYRLLLEQRNQERFGCSIAELDVLFIGYAPESKKLIIDIIKGRSVELSAIEGSGVDIQYEKLKKIFPNINLKIIPKPQF